MRSSKSRSRNKSNRQRSLGNIVNRVFDSSGPEGKVRGTPQQIIDKYLTLARDAQLSNDRVAEQSFFQHAEHYTRMLGEAQREIAERQQHQQGNNHNQRQNGDDDRDSNGGRDHGQRDNRDQGGRDQSGRDQGSRDQSGRDHASRDHTQRDNGQGDAGSAATAAPKADDGENVAAGAAAEAVAQPAPKEEKPQPARRGRPRRIVDETPKSESPAVDQAQPGLPDAVSSEAAEGPVATPEEGGAKKPARARTPRVPRSTAAPRARRSKTDDAESAPADAAEAKPTDGDADQG